MCVCVRLCMCTGTLACIWACRTALVCMQCGADAAVGWYVIGYIVDNATSPVNVLCVLYGYIYIYEHVHVCGYMCACTLADALPYTHLYMCTCVCIGRRACMHGGWG